MSPLAAIKAIFVLITRLDRDHPIKQAFDALIDEVEDYADEVGGLTDIALDVACNAIRTAFNVADNDKPE